MHSIANGLESRIEIADISSRLIANRASAKKKHGLIQPLVDQIEQAIKH